MKSNKTNHGLEDLVEWAQKEELSIIICSDGTTKITATINDEELWREEIIEKKSLLGALRYAKQLKKKYKTWPEFYEARRRYSQEEIRISREILTPKYLDLQIKEMKERKKLAPKEFR